MLTLSEDVTTRGSYYPNKNMATPAVRLGLSCLADVR